MALAKVTKMIDGEVKQVALIDYDEFAGNPTEEMDQIWEFSYTKSGYRWGKNDAKSKYAWVWDRLYEIGQGDWYGNDDASGYTWKREDKVTDHDWDRSNYIDIYELLVEYNDETAYDFAMKILDKRFDILPLARLDHEIREHHSERSDPDGFMWASWDRIKVEKCYKRITKDRLQKIKAHRQGELHEFSAWANGNCYFVALHDMCGHCGNLEDEAFDYCSGFYSTDDAIDSAKEQMAEEGATFVVKWS